MAMRDEVQIGIYCLYCVRKFDSAIESLREMRIECRSLEYEI